MHGAAVQQAHGMPCETPASPSLNRGKESTSTTIHSNISNFNKPVKDSVEWHLLKLSRRRPSRDFLRSQPGVRRGIRGACAAPDERQALALAWPKFLA